jgi:hypothetical protein
MTANPLNDSDGRLVVESCGQPEPSVALDKIRRAFEQADVAELAE